MSGNALLRQQLIMLQRQIKRPKLTWRDRALFVLLANTLRAWKQARIIVQVAQGSGTEVLATKPTIRSRIQTILDLS